MAKEKTNNEKKGMLDRILDSIERVGNKLPDPITLFLGLAIAVVIISAICSMLGVTAVNPADGSTVETFNLFSVAGLQYLWSNVITNFSGFAPLGMVLVAVIGSSVAEKSGFLVALMEHFLGGAKGWIVSMVVIFLGINLNIAGDAGFIILPPLAAILFMSIGRSPLLGLYVAFASVAAGFCANILLGLSDALAYGFTEAAAQMIDPGYSSSMAINWYFLIVSCLVLTVAGTILVEKVMVHRSQARLVHQLDVQVSVGGMHQRASARLQQSLDQLVAAIEVFVTDDEAIDDDLGRVLAEILTERATEGKAVHDHRAAHGDFRSFHLKGNATEGSRLKNFSEVHGDLDTHDEVVSSFPVPSMHGQGGRC